MDLQFVLKNNVLQLIKNPINDESKFYRYRDFLDEIRNNDFFYGKKFKKEKISFPYSISVLKNARRNLSIIYWIYKINNLKSNSILMILGKGTENYQIIKNDKIYHNDAEIVKNLL